MNKILTVALLAGGLLLLDSPEAAAHKEIRHTYQPSAYYRFETRRAKKMPFWLKRDRSFRRWYKHTRLRRNSYLAWHQLFDIYRWERGYVKRHHRGDSHVNIYYRDYDRDDRRRYRH
jgi:hypothetical protein